MEKIDSAKLEIWRYRSQGWNSVSLSDGSIRILITRAVKSETPLIELKKSSWGRDNEFTLLVNLPEAEKLVAVIQLYRPSKNTYCMVASDNKETDYKSFGTLSDLNNYIGLLFERYKPQ